eukprot:11354037-Alexandrium_andersonii.AAC.1
MACRERTRPLPIVANIRDPATLKRRSMGTRWSVSGHSVWAQQGLHSLAKCAARPQWGRFRRKHSHPIRTQ